MLAAVVAGVWPFRSESRRARAEQDNGNSRERARIIAYLLAMRIKR